MLRFGTLFVLSFLSLLYASEGRQVIVVETKDWNANSGTLQRYEVVKGEWIKQGEAIKVKLGRNGMGWGVGLHQIPKRAALIKKEGDGRAPAGIFELKAAFGYHPLNVRYPYKRYTRKHHCVDDPDSRYYNKIVDAEKIKRDYKSFEYMKLDKDYYKYGVAVNHNRFDEKGAIPGRGSCIFLHIKSTPTAGCTVMDENKMVELIKWLDPDKKPLLIQAPRHEIKRLKRHLDAS